MASEEQKIGDVAPEFPETAETSEKNDDSNRTLAEEVQQNEYQMYQRSQKHLQEIEEEVRQTQKLCGEKEEASALVRLYDPVTSPQYFSKARDLSKKYSHFRRIRGDGNCFYRAVLTALLEKCSEDEALLNKFTGLIKSWKAKLFTFGFPELTTSDFCEAMETLVEAMQRGHKPASFLYDDLNDDNIANYYVAFMRLITSAFLRENEAIYSGFIEGLRNMDQFCKDEVEPMWKEVDHMGIIGLLSACGVGARIEYMDQTQSPNGSIYYDVPDGEEVILFFLYRPGHYDILYSKP